MSDAPQGPGWWQASDGKFYPPQAPPPPYQQPGFQQPMYQQPMYQQPVQPVAAKSGCGKWILAAVIVAILGVGGCVAVLAIGGKAVSDEVDRQMGEAADGDYELVGPTCAVDDMTGPEANGTITNTSKEAQAFEIKVRFTAAGKLISEDSTFTDQIDVGQATDYKVVTLETDAPPDTTCELVEVNYTIFDDQNEGK